MVFAETIFGLEIGLPGGDSGIRPKLSKVFFDSFLNQSIVVGSVQLFSFFSSFGALSCL